MKQLWIDLSNFGIHDGLPYHRARKSRLFNQISLLTTFFLPIFSIINILQRKYTLAWVEVVYGSLLILNLLINRSGRHHLATAFYFTEVFSFLALLTIVFSPGRDLEYMLLAAGIVPLIFYQNRWITLSLFMISFILFVIAKIRVEGKQDYVAYLNYLTTFCLIYFLVKYLKDEYERHSLTIETQKAELEALNEEKNQLISIASHDLRSPLQRVQGLLSLLTMGEGVLSPEQKDIISTAQKEVKQQTSMISKMLDVYSLKENKSMHLEKTDLAPILDTLIKSFQPVADRKNIAITFESTLNGSRAICDKSYATHIFENLLSNAVKFSYPNSTVHVSLYSKSNKILTSVRDEGQGLDAEDQKKLFRRFQKLSATPTAGEHTSGLGLAIVKKYVDVMNGQIWCESEKGKGANFIVALPQTKK